MAKLAVAVALLALLAIAGQATAQTSFRVSRATFDTSRIPFTPSPDRVNQIFSYARLLVLKSRVSSFYRIPLIDNGVARITVIRANEISSVLRFKTQLDGIAQRYNLQKVYPNIRGLGRVSRADGEVTYYVILTGDTYVNIRKDAAKLVNTKGGVINLAKSVFNYTVGYKNLNLLNIRPPRDPRLSDKIADIVLV